LQREAVGDKEASRAAVTRLYERLGSMPRRS
jgi:hypothetical protein